MAEARDSLVRSGRDAAAPAIGQPFAARASTASRRLADYLELAKPRVVLMVLVTTLAGYYLGAGGTLSAGLVLHALAGTALAAAGTMALNQYMERESDGRMARTRTRPLPDGRLGAGEALAFGLALLAAGLVHLAVATNLLAAGITAAIAASYLLIYTPLKTVTPLCSVVGAVPGALPPVAGWAVARGSVDIEAIVLFGIMFLWQIPHTLAISALYRDDYARAGIRVLPAVDRNGPSTALYAVGYSLALLPVALMPTVFGFAGPVYFVVAFALGLAFLWSAIGLARLGTLDAARRLMVTSLVYLPALLGMLALDRVPLR